MLIICYLAAVVLLLACPSRYSLFSPPPCLHLSLLVTCSSGRSHPAPVTTFPLRCIFLVLFTSNLQTQSPPTDAVVTAVTRPPVITPSKYGLPTSLAPFDSVSAAFFSSPADDYATGNKAQASTPRHHQGRTSTREADIVNTSPSRKQRAIDLKAILVAIGTFFSIRSFTSAAPPPLSCFAASSKAPSVCVSAQPRPSSWASAARSAAEVCPSSSSITDRSSVSRLWL